MTMQALPELMTEAQAAKKFQRSANWLRDLAKAGYVEYVQLGASRYYTEQALCRMVEKCTSKQVESHGA